MAGKIENPALYRELSAPFADRKAAADAVDAYFKESRELRIKHRLADVNQLVYVSYMENGAEHRVMFTMHNGDSTKALPMLAQAFGAARRDYEKLVEALTEME